MNYLLCLNWNTSDMLIRMYESAIKYAEKPFHLFIIDNGSKIDEIQKLEQKIDKCFIKFEQSNLGFAAGNNAGLAFIDHYHLIINNYQIEDANIIFINSDIIIEEQGWDSKFEQLLKDDVGIVGCAYHPLVWTKDARFHIKPIPNESVESETVQGAFFGVKKSLLDEVKGFDENFKYAHYEETDLQLRIMKLGYKCLWTPCKHIHDHDHSATKKHGFHLNDEIKNQTDFKANSERNRQLLLQKHKDWFSTK